MIYVLIVIYNNKIEELPIFSYKSQNVSFVLFDNSTKDDCLNHNKEFASQRNYEYITHNKNMGLCLAYNEIIKTHLTNDCDWLLILDDDSTISSDYLSLVEERTKTSTSLFFSPINIDKTTNKIDSPLIFKKGFLLRHKHINLNDKDSNLFISINNGSVISKKAFDEIGLYPENLFIYFSDTYFYHIACLKGIKTEIIDYKNICCFSASSHDYKGQKRHLQLLKPDAKVYFKEVYKEFGHPHRWFLHYSLFMLLHVFLACVNTNFIYFFPYLFAKK